MTFAEIKAKQEALWSRSRSKLAFEIYNLVWDAEDNANDTIYAEKAAPESDFEALAFGTLIDLIGSRDCSKNARAWFKRIGLKF